MRPHWLLTAALVAAVLPVPPPGWHLHPWHEHPTAQTQQRHDVHVSHEGYEGGVGVNAQARHHGPAIDAEAYFAPPPGDPDPDGGDPDPDGGDGQTPQDDGPSSAGVLPATLGIPAEAADYQLPNLVPQPAAEVVIGKPDRSLHAVDQALAELGRPEPVVEGPVLRFTTTIVNRGDYAFDLAGFPGVPDPESQGILTTEAYQCVLWGPAAPGEPPRVCTRYEKIGTLSYHAHHRHFHIDGFAKYQLRRDDNGQPMHGPGSVVAESSKVGWCVSDMEPPAGRSGTPIGGDRWYQECSGLSYMPISTRQGISPGWSDTYYRYFAGQQIPITGVPDGVYWISIWMNPPDNAFDLKIRETNHADNISYQRIRLSGGGTKVETL